MIIGLSKEEMDDDSDDDDDDNDNDDADGEAHVPVGSDPEAAQPKEISYGYALPDEADAQFDRIKMKLDASVNACKVTHQKFIQNQSTRRTLGPSFPPPNASNAASAFDLQDDSDDDEDGPAPLGSAMAKKRRMKGPALSSAAVKQMANERQAQMIHATTGIDPSASTENQREEWMMKPGEHDFLQGVLSKGIMNRTFKNEKGKVVDAPPDAPLDPRI